MISIVDFVKKPSPRLTPKKGIDISLSEEGEAYHG